MTLLRSKAVLPARRAAVLLLALLCSVPSLAALAATAVPTGEAAAITRPTTDAGWATLEALLAQEAEELVARLPLLEGQRRRGSIRVKLEPEKERIIFMMSRDYLAAKHHLALEDVLGYLREDARGFASPAITLTSFEYLFDGKPLEYYFPDDVPGQIRQPSAAQQPDQFESLPSVAVAAGHGLYYHHGFKDWRAQRDSSHGMLEDDVTLVYASQLASKLQRQHWGVAIQSRGDDSQVHEPSGQPWRRLASRYWLQKQLPEQKHIWNSLPTATHVLRERDEDIRSRPLYAKFMGVDAAINLHTNAHSMEDARGTRVIFHEGRDEDRKFAQNVLCYMRESIHSVGKYADWGIPSSPGQSVGLGESRLANMPSIIVELGFHTNPSDAEALQDFNFRRMAVNGIAKGWRMYAQGIGCEPLQIIDIPDVQGVGERASGLKCSIPAIQPACVRLIRASRPARPSGAGAVRIHCGRWKTVSRSR